jgi:hypothetical protein
VIYGGVSLEDHWHARVALDSIATRRWDGVVLQQGPSSLDASRPRPPRNAVSETHGSKPE